jgi:hypothetical protein
MLAITPATGVGVAADLPIVLVMQLNKVLLTSIRTCARKMNADFISYY